MTAIGEQWRPVVGFGGYEVSNLGRVASMRRGWFRIMNGTRSRDGYQVYRLRTDRIGGPAAQSREVHRLVAEAFIGPRPEGQEVRHIDGNPQNNALSNLTYGTRSQNVRDSIRHGTHTNASKTHCANGHLLDEGNTYSTWRGRVCRTCNRAAVARYKTRKQHAAAGIKGVAA